MASKSSSSKRLKKLADEIPPDAAVQTHLDVMQDEPYADHAVAMMGAGLIETALEVAILSRLIPMNNEDRKRLFSYDYRGPLCDLSARIRMGLAMGLYGPQTFHDLERIRAVRNAFAHSLWYITFSTPEVSDNCEFHVTKQTAIADNGSGQTASARYVRATTFIAEALKTRIQAVGIYRPDPMPPPDERLP